MWNGSGRAGRAEGEPITAALHARGDIHGLVGLEPSIEKRIEYMGFIDIYSPLDDNERRLYEQRYPQENEEMLTWSERARHAGIQQGLLQGREEGREDGERELLARLLSRRFGPLDRQPPNACNAPPASSSNAGPNMLEARSPQPAARRTYSTSIEVIFAGKVCHGMIDGFRYALPILRINDGQK